MTDIAQPFAPAPAAPVAAPEPLHLYAKHQFAHEIDYAPEVALKEGLAMVNTLKLNIKKLELESKMRKDVWLREIERCVYARIWAMTQRL